MARTRFLRCPTALVVVLLAACVGNQSGVTGSAGTGDVGSPAEAWSTTRIEGPFALVGANPNLALDGDGGLVVAHTIPSVGNQGVGFPMVVWCPDSDCTRSEQHALETPGFHTVLALDARGLPVLAIHDFETVSIARCPDPACSEATITQVASGGSYSSPVALAVGADDLPVVAVFDTNTYFVTVLRCGDPSCTSGNSATRLSSLVDPDGTKWFVQSPSLALTSGGLPVLAVAQGDGRVRTVACSDQVCTRSTVTTLDDTASELNVTATMKLGPDGLPVVAWYGAGHLRVAHCQDPACTTFTANTIADSVDEFIADVTPSLAFDTAGNPIVAYWQTSQEGIEGCSDEPCQSLERHRVLGFARCGDPTCSRVALSTYGEANSFTLTIAPDGHPFLAYLAGSFHQQSGFDVADAMVVARCQHSSCLPEPPG